MTLAFKNEVYFLKPLDKTSSVTSFPKSPQNNRKSFSGHSSKVGSSHISPPAFLKVLFFFLITSFLTLLCFLFAFTDLFVFPSFNPELVTFNELVVVRVIPFSKI